MVPYVLIALSEEELDQIVKQRADLMEQIGRREFLSKYSYIAELLDDLRYEWKSGNAD